jgi:hypothetical protein
MGVRLVRCIQMPGDTYMTLTGMNFLYIRDVSQKKAVAMDFKSNAFCASGMHLPNGSFATFGGNGAIGPGGNIGSVFGDGTGAFDATYQDYDGGKSIRILNPCKGDASSWDTSCQWFDDSSLLAMQKRRWYSTAEALADGTIVLIGGFQNGSVLITAAIA